jgi:hypothetical protein
MDGFLALLVMLAVFGPVLGGLPWLASRVRRRGAGESVMGPFDEIWHPAAYRARIEIQVQEERPASMPLPGDRWSECGPVFPRTPPAAAASP